MSDIFEPIFDGSILSDAVIVTLRAWVPTYLKELKIQRNLTDTIPNIRTYTSRNQFSSFPDDQIPMAVVISPGMASPPMQEGDGALRAWWQLGVGVIASANTQDNADRLAKMYGAAVRAILLQKQGLDESWEYDAVELGDESYDDIPDPDQERTMRAARLAFRVLVCNITTRYAGPAYPDAPDPDTQPGSEWPTVETADVVVEMKEDS